MWIKNRMGEIAQIDDADREYWVQLHDWSETGEPGDDERGSVWLTNPETGHGAPIAWAAREYWLGRGWKPGPPDKPVNPTKDPALTHVASELPPDGTADEVTEWVGTDQQRAEQALLAEQTRPKPRKTVVEALQHVGQSDADGGETVTPT